MNYLSTRGGMPPKTFTEILLGGLATDGGLTIPDAYPKLSKEELAAMRKSMGPDTNATYLSQM